SACWRSACIHTRSWRERLGNRIVDREIPVGKSPPRLYTGTIMKPASSASLPAPPQTTAAGPGGLSDASRHLHLLLGISRAIGTIVDQDRLITQIIEHVTSAFGADRTTLFVHDRQRRQLWSRIAQGLDQYGVLRIDESH